MRLIFKNLWNRRGKYAWLFIELIIVTVISWWMLDRAAVSISDANLPLGYEADRLVVVKVSTLPSSARNYVPDLDSAAVAANFDTFIGKLRRYPGVERVSPQTEGNILNEQSLSVNGWRAGSAADTLGKVVNSITFTPGTEYFETYGIEAAPGSPSIEELSSRSYIRFNELVITEDLAERYWPGENGVGKCFFYVRRDGGDTVYQKVVGVVKNVRYQTYNRTNCATFSCYGPLRKNRYSYDMVVRLAPGISPESFAREFVDYAAKNMTTGNYYVKSVTPYSGIIAEAEYNTGVTADRNTILALTAFFLINLVLGVVGSFYLQTRRRIAEVGVHRSFGATRPQIVRMLMGEGVVLATFAFIIGDLIFLQYALKFGFNTGFNNNQMYFLIDNWVGNFWQHFGVVSALVYAAIIICVIIGTLMPSLEASRVHPVTALRDE